MGSHKPNGCLLIWRPHILPILQRVGRKMDAQNVQEIVSVTHKSNYKLKQLAWDGESEDIPFTVLISSRTAIVWFGSMEPPGKCRNRSNRLGESAEYVLAPQWLEVRTSQTLETDSGANNRTLLDSLGCWVTLFWEINADNYLNPSSLFKDSMRPKVPGTQGKAFSLNYETKTSLSFTELEKLLAIPEQISTNSEACSCTSEISSRTDGNSRSRSWTSTAVPTDKTT